MPPKPEENARAYLQRLLRESAQQTWPLIRASRRACEESRELLREVEKKHPGT